MAFMHDDIYDTGLNHHRDNAGTYYICSSEPTNYTEATVTFALGSKANPTIGTVQDGAVSGRRIVVGAVTDGSTTANGTAGFWAFVKDTAPTKALSTGPLAATQEVTAGNIWTTPAFDCAAIGDAVVV